MESYSKWVFFSGFFQRFICVVVCISSYSLFLLSSNLVYGYTTVYPFIYRWTHGLFPVFGYYKESCYEHSCINLCIDFFSLWSEMAGLYGRCMFNWINSQTAFQSDCAILHFYQQCVRVLILPYLCHFVWSLFNFRHSGMCVVVSPHFGFNLHFPNG